LSEVDLGAAGLPGVKYIYGGNIRRLETKSGNIIRLKALPWKLKSDDIIKISSELKVLPSDLENVFIKLHDAFEEAPPEKKRGTTQTRMIPSWEDVVKYDAKGDAKGLNHQLIAKLLAENCARIGDIILKVENNIGTILTKEELKILILNGLKSAHAEDLYGMTTYQLVRDQLLPLIPQKELGSILGKLPVKNGVLDIQSGRIVPVDGIYMKTMEVAYNPEATSCPKISKILDNMFLPEQKELVLSVIGAAISGRRAPFVLCLSGAGRNGKSILRELLESLMMQLITTEKLENLNKDFVNGVFLGKRISWNTEVSSTRKFTEEIKEITGGTTIQVRKKFVDGELQYPLQMVAIIDTNSPPHFDESQAINDRVRFINMPRTFVYDLSGAANEVLIDPNLVENWKAELPAFLNMLLPYAQHFLDHGHLKQDISGTVAQLRERSNLLSGFILDWCDTSDYNRSVSIQTFQKYYVKYAKSKNVAAPEVDHLRYKLRNDFGLQVRGMTVQGVSIRKELRLPVDEE
jgi:hypothetical protein